jgi:hypothetical protein
MEVAIAPPAERHAPLPARRAVKKSPRKVPVGCLTSPQMNDDMTRARSTPGAGGSEARAKPLPSLASLLPKALQGAVFPLSVRQLVRVARENGASAELLTQLESLPRGEFRSLEAVQSALASEAQGRARSATLEPASTPER